MSNLTNRFSRGTIFVFGLILVAILVTILLAYELIAVLYVLATLALVVLLLTVAMSNLEDVDRDAVDGFSPEKK
jgi:low affinity Fe/Cu permease